MIPTSYRLTCLYKKKKNAFWDKTLDNPLATHISIPTIKYYLTNLYKVKHKQL